MAGSESGVMNFMKPDLDLSKLRAGELKSDNGAVEVLTANELEILERVLDALRTVKGPSFGAVLAQADGTMTEIETDSIGMVKAIDRAYRTCGEVTPNETFVLDVLGLYDEGDLNVDAVEILVAAYRQQTEHGLALLAASKSLALNAEEMTESSTDSDSPEGGPNGSQETIH